MVLGFDQKWEGPDGSIYVHAAKQGPGATAQVQFLQCLAYLYGDAATASTAMAYTWKWWDKHFGGEPTRRPVPSLGEERFGLASESGGGPTRPPGFKVYLVGWRKGNLVLVLEAFPNESFTFRDLVAIARKVDGNIA